MQAQSTSPGRNVTSPPRSDLLLGGLAAAGLTAYTWAAGEAGTDAAIGTGLALMMGAGVAWRRRAPVASGIAIAVAVVAYELAVRRAGVALMAPLLLGFYSMGAHAPLRRASVGFGLACAAVGVEFVGDDAWLENMVFVGLVAGSVWAGGVAVRVNRARARQLSDLAAELEREREEKARLAVAEERTRIARELHDVIAHSVSVIAVQAGAGRHTLGVDPQRAHDAFAAIEETARQALAEMRRLLGLLRETQEPVSAAPLPGMDSHEQLIEQARGAGVSVDVETDGEPRGLPAGVDLAAYRVLQEALTNVRKHAPGARAAVRIRYGAAEVEIEVRNDAASTATEHSNGGHGLIGMRERVALYQGELEAGPLPQGGFRVRVRLPLHEERA